MLSAQKLIGHKNKLFKVVLSRSGQTTKGYSNSPLPAAARRILSISHSEQPDTYKADIILRNSDKALVSLDFENYQVVVSHGYKTGVTRTAWAANTAYVIDDVRRPTTANGFQYRCAIAGTSHATTEPTWPTDLGVRVTDGTVTWEMDGQTGVEYDRTAPLKVRVQELHSGRGILRCIIRAVGIPDQLKEEDAIAEYTQLDTDTNTVKTLISAVCAAGTGLSSAYNGYQVIEVVYDSEDSLIDTFCPADYFSISVGENRWSKIEELLAYTGCKARIGNDGKLHILVPVTTGTTYDYEYRWNVATYHTFFNKTVRSRFVQPNKEIVRTPASYDTQYTGNATSATSYALDPRVRTTYRRLASDAQATSIAEAIIAGTELSAERGFATVPTNVGQELWDYVKVTDSRQGDTRTGNVQYIQRDTRIPEGNEALTFSTALALGTPSLLSIMANAISAAGAEGAAGARGEPGVVGSRFTNEQIRMLLDDLANDVWRELIKLALRVKGIEASGYLTFGIDVTLSDGGTVLSTGIKKWIEIPFNCTIQRVTMTADVSGSLVVDIWKDAYANFPPTNDDSITASAPPTLSSAQKSQDATLTGWTTTIMAGSFLMFNVDSCTTITQCTLSLKLKKS